MGQGDSRSGWDLCERPRLGGPGTEGVGTGACGRIALQRVDSGVVETAQPARDLGVICLPLKGGVDKRAGLPKGSARLQQGGQRREAVLKDYTKSQAAASHFLNAPSTSL